jgi:hypothetical protein
MPADPRCRLGSSGSQPPDTENALARLISEHLRNEGLQCRGHDRTHVSLDSESELLASRLLPLPASVRHG